MKQEPCTYLPDTAGDFLPTSSSDIRQLSLLSGIPTPAKSSENEQQTDGSQTCECGKGTFNCLIHPNTPEKWTAFMQDSLAKTLALLESRQAYMREPDQVFTAKSCASLAWYDQSNSSWKTYQQSLVTDWEPYSGTWPRWGMTQGGSAYAHPMSERRITETDGSYSLPTPTAAMEAPNKRANTKGPKNLVEVAQGKWNHMWPTPTAHNAKEMGYPAEYTRKTIQLGSMVKMWPTPNASDSRDRGNMSNPAIQRRAEIGKQLNLSMVVHPTSGQLNPTWVEWLMGFPIGFTVSKDWVTPKSRSKRQQPTDSLGESDAP